jgi:hypothetical protein
MGQLHFVGGELLFDGGELTMHDDCCCGGTDPSCLSSWTFTDKGFIDGGQDGALREYASPGSVSNSPWSFASSGGLTGLRCDFEDSDDVPPAYAGTKPPTTGDNCANYNAYTQTATATGTLTLASNGYIAITWDGVGETQDSEFEMMQVKLDGVQIGFAHAPGGDLGCTAGAAVVAVPPSGTSYPVAAGTHTIEVRVSTNDQFYHVGSYYQFVIDCAAAAGDDCDADAEFTATLIDDCEWELEATTAVDPNCVWDYVVTTPNNTWTGSGTGCTFTLNILDCTSEAALDERMPTCDCGEIEVEVTLTVGTKRCTQTLTCTGCEPDGGPPVIVTEWECFGCDPEDEGNPDPDCCPDQVLAGFPCCPGTCIGAGADDDCEYECCSFVVEWPNTDTCGNPLTARYCFVDEACFEEIGELPCDHGDYLSGWHAFDSVTTLGGVSQGLTHNRCGVTAQSCIIVRLFRDDCCEFFYCLSRTVCCDCADYALPE